MTQGQGLFKKFMCIHILVDKPSGGLRTVLPTASTETPDLTASAAALLPASPSAFRLQAAGALGPTEHPPQVPAQPRQQGGETAAPLPPGKGTEHSLLCIYSWGKGAGLKKDFEDICDTIGIVNKLDLGPCN